MGKIEWIVIAGAILLCILLIWTTADSTEYDNDNVAEFKWAYEPHILCYLVVIEQGDGSDTTSITRTTNTNKIFIPIVYGLKYRIATFAISDFLVMSHMSEWSNWVTMSDTAIWITKLEGGVYIQTADTETKIYSAPTPTNVDWEQIGVWNIFVPIDTQTKKGFFRGSSD